MKKGHKLTSTERKTNAVRRGNQNPRHPKAFFLFLRLCIFFKLFLLFCSPIKCFFQRLIISSFVRAGLLFPNLWTVKKKVLSFVIKNSPISFIVSPKPLYIFKKLWYKKKHAKNSKQSKTFQKEFRKNKASPKNTRKVLFLWLLLFFFRTPFLKFFRTLRRG